jgi:hypothetical protein
MYCRAPNGHGTGSVSSGLSLRLARVCRALALLTCFAVSAIAVGADFIVFGPHTYQRKTGRPVAVTSGFLVTTPFNPYTLRVTNHGVTSAVISVNGQVVLTPTEFVIDGTVVPLLERPVTLRAGDNQTSVELRGKPGASLEVEIVGALVDTAPPTITAAVNPPPNAAGWNHTNVTVTFTCADTGSGIATCPAPLVFSDEAANQPVSGMAVDKAGNSATANLTLNIDKTPPVVTASRSPDSNANGWNSGPVIVTFAATDSLSDVVPGSITAPVTLSADGANLSAAGQATDLAGNVGSVTSAGINIDRSAPVLTVTLDPPPVNGWNNSPVTVHFICSDGGAGIDTCPPDKLVAGDGVAQGVAGTAMDRAGNTATAFATVNLDRTPPAFTLSAPANGAILFTPTVTATGTVTDSLSGIAGVTCGDVQATVSGTSFGCDLTLARGANSFRAIATDAAGNTTSLDLGLNYTRVPVITLETPENGAYLSISPTTIRGNVDDPTATVTINSIPAATADGSFSIALPLAEGPNIITVSATTTDGAVGTASVDVTLDTTPPHVTITSPPDQYVTTAASISVAGNVNDIVVGTVNDEQARVAINGAAAQVANRTFLLADVPLVSGPNVLQAVGTDRVGNAATTQITVMRREATLPRITMISGNNQAGAIGSLLIAPLVVAVTDAAGNPFPNTPVVFKVAQNDGLVAANGATGPTVIASTDAEGKAQAYWTLGSRAGAGGNSVEAYSVGYEGTAIFTATGRQGIAGKIVVDTGNDQIGPIGQPLPKPFIAVVVDTGNNRLAGVQVMFAALQGGGTFDGQQSIVVETDSVGRAAATLTLGMQEGNANNFVQANFPSNQSFAAAFTASGRAPGNPANTTISGVVLDNSNAPIPDVTVRAVLTNVLHSNLNAVQTAAAIKTDAEGQFSIGQAPVGLVKLLVDGQTAQPPGTYPSLEYDMVTVAGQINTVGQPIYLLPLSTANQLCVTETSGGGTLTIPEAPGFSLTFGPGQVTFPGGAKTGCVGVTAVHGDKVPMVPGFGQQPRFIVTIQPAGAVFNPPAPITLPNVDGLKPREVTEMYSFDHDIGSFVAIGTGVVSDDGLIIRSSAGVGVLKAGWHCGGNPSTTGAAADCGPCQQCLTDHCEADPSQNGQTLPEDKCKVCENGSPKDVPVNGLGVELSYTFGPPAPSVDKFNEELDKLKSLGVIAKVNVLQITGKISEKECCDPEAGTGKGKETSGSVSGNFGGFDVKGKLWPPGPIPYLKIRVDVFGLASLEAKAEFVGGIFLGLAGKVEGEIGYKKKECSKDPADRAGCLFAGLNIKLTPSLSAEVGGVASLTYDCFFCDKTTIEVEGSFILGELSWPIDFAGVSYNKESCSAGLTGGFFNPGKGEFKVAAKFKGTYKTDDTGSRSVDLTLDFLKCEFTTSSIECSVVNPF